VLKSDFGPEFKWGVATAAYQVEGGHNADGKGPSIWDHFSKRKGKIRQGQHGDHATDFYNRYREDISIMKSLSIPNFRFSISWPRVMPDGISINPSGISFYDRLIDNCLESGIEPWITLYHWDLPLALQNKGGWKNRDVVSWFSAYTTLCARHFGDRVRYWMVLNEPMVFTGAGYFLGLHAPGEKGVGKFLSSVHHTALCQAVGGRILKLEVPQAEIGTTFSCSMLSPASESKRDVLAVKRTDALLNRLFVEPALGLGYPSKDLKFLERLEKYFHADDEKNLKFDFDFIGIQNYTREVIRYSWFTPFIHAKIIPPQKRGVEHTVMNWEIYPESIYHMLKKFSSYSGIKKIYVTESGAAFPDTLAQGRVIDPDRTSFLQAHLAQILKAKHEGIPVEGFLIWTFTDNFEWAQGYHPRFGLVHVDFETQQRTVKDSGLWYKRFLEEVI
jgi:beta-glucosidase